MELTELMKNGTFSSPLLFHLSKIIFNIVLRHSQFVFPSKKETKYHTHKIMGKITFVYLDIRLLNGATEVTTL
jgi:hypothetical protein